MHIELIHVLFYVEDFVTCDASHRSHVMGDIVTTVVMCMRVLHPSNVTSPANYPVQCAQEGYACSSNLNAQMGA